MTLSSVFAYFRSIAWFVRLVRRSNAGLPRDQWFASALDEDVRWVAGQASSRAGEVRHLVLEAKREMARRGLA